MKFNWKRGIWVGALLWVLIFFEVSILMFGFSIQDTMSSIAHQISIIFLVLFCSWVYFKGKVEREWNDGLVLGLVFVVTGFILDALITVPLFVKSYSFFASGLLWAGYLEGIVLTVLYSMFERKRKRRK